MMSVHKRGLVVAALALAAQACASAPPGGAPSPATPAQAQVVLTPVERARADSARLPYTRKDVEFMYNMIGHHTQALVMARLAPTHGASASVQRLASRVMNAQEDEIHTMRTWLMDRRQPVPEPDASGEMPMLMDGMQHHMLMPGMLSPQQMKQLEAATGKEFDRLFLTFMIQHHQGAVSMVKELFATYGAGQDETVFKFASDVNVDQTTEIERMQKMLAEITMGVTLP